MRVIFIREPELPFITIQVVTDLLGYEVVDSLELPSPCRVAIIDTALVSLKKKCKPSITCHINGVLVGIFLWFALDMHMFHERTHSVVSIYTHRSTESCISDTKCIKKRPYNNQRVNHLISRRNNAPEFATAAA